MLTVMIYIVLHYIPLILGIFLYIIVGLEQLILIIIL